MIVTIKFKNNEFLNAHKVARAIKAVTGRSYKTEAGITFTTISFDYFFCNDKISETGPELIERINADTEAV